MAVTQAALVGMQLLLLPLQVRLWGSAVTAQWNGAIALASIVCAADLGLKSFGHSALSAAAPVDLHSDAEFTSVWAAIRLLIAGIALLAVSAAWGVSSPNSRYMPSWIVWLVLAFALECLMVSRGMYLDSLGRMADQEACYSLIVCTRLFGAVLALLAFDASPSTLAQIYALSALVGLAAQSRVIRDYPALRLMAGGFGSITGSTLRLLQYSIGYPLADWCRISMPVLVLGAVASAGIVNAFVALRAVFGFARAAAQHVSRYASVQYTAISNSSPDLRRQKLAVWCMVSIAFSTAFALGVVLDGGLLMSKWIPGTSTDLYDWVSLVFALNAPFFANQLLVMACMRAGGEGRAAKLQIAYVALALLATVGGLIAGSVPIFLGMWLLSELAFAGLVLAFTRQQGVARPFLQWAMAGVALILACFLVVRWMDLWADGHRLHLALRFALFVTLVGLMLMQLRNRVRDLATGRLARRPLQTGSANSGNRPWRDAVNRPRIFVYGARDETFLSGTPYYFSAALRRINEAEGSFTVTNLAPRRTREIPLRWLAWTARMRCARVSLFLLSQPYHDASVPDFSPRTDDAGCISFSQILPRAVIRHKIAHRNFKLVQYIDATLSQLFVDFDYARNAPSQVRESLLQAERRSYELADQIVAFHEGVKQSLIESYGVPPDRVTVLGRGVNLPADAMCAAGETRMQHTDGRLRLMVVGRGPRRKGVFRLIEAIDALEPEEQARVELHLAGPALHELPHRSYLHPMGFVSAAQRPTLVTTMKSMSLGVLLSEAEGYPGSVWEFLFLGVPVWVSQLPYLEDELRGFPAVIQPFPLERAALTAQLRRFLHDSGLLARLMAHAARPRADLSWAWQASAIAKYVCGKSSSVTRAPTTMGSAPVGIS